MKMNFREWAAILEAVTDKLENVSDCDWWYDEDGKVREGYEDNVKEAKAKKDMLNGIIRKIEGATL